MKVLLLVVACVALTQGRSIVKESEEKSLVTKDEVTYNDGPVDVLATCKMMLGSCLSSAKGNLIHMAACTAQAAVCTGMNLAWCSKECIPDAVICHSLNIGNWLGTFGCCAKFITCGIGGCIRAGDEPLSEASGELALHDSVADTAVLNSLPDCFKDAMNCAKTSKGEDRMACMTAFTTCMMKMMEHPDMGGCKGGAKCKPVMVNSLECLIKIMLDGSMDDITKCLKPVVKCCSKGEDNAAGNDVTIEKIMKAVEPATSKGGMTYGLFTDVLDACKAGLGSCLREAHGDLIRIGLCAGQFGVCSAMNLLDCSKDCIPPMISCTASSVGDFGGTFKCVADFIACGIGGCLKGGGGGGGGVGPMPPMPPMNDEPVNDETVEKLAKALEPVTSLVKTNAASKAYGLFTDVLDACKAGLGACLKSAHGNVFHFAACTGQFGVCSAMNLLDCSKDCIPPMIGCTKNSMGDFGATFKCVADFIACGLGGCLKGGGGGGGGGPMPPMPPVNDEPNADKLIKGLQPVTSLIPSAPAAYGIFTDVLDACKAGLGSCLREAHGDLIRLGLCAGQFGVCSAMNLLDCSKDCIPPMISCTASSVGDFGGAFKCVANFIACGIGGCLKGGGGGGGGGGPMPPMPPMSDEPVDADKLIKALEPVAALAPSAPAAYGLFTDVLDACKAGLGSCLASAHGDLLRLGLCAGQFGVCSAMNLLDCSKDCIPPMISCTKDSIGDFGATFKCVADFIACGIGGCLKGGGGGGGGGPMPPMPPVIDEPVDADKLIKGLQPVTALTSAPAAYGLFTDVLDACKAGLGSCLASAHGDLLRLGLCAGQFGVCSAMNLLDCSKDCIPPMISCTKDSIGDFGATFKCVADFIACGIGGCLKGGGGGGGGGAGPMPPMPPMSDEPVDADKLIKGLEPVTALVLSAPAAYGIFTDVLDACKAGLGSCLASAHGDLLRLGLCAGQFGVCSAMNLLDCSKDCIPPMIGCTKNSIGDFGGTFKCVADFIACGIGGCLKGGGGGGGGGPMPPMPPMNDEPVYADKLIKGLKPLTTHGIMDYGYGLFTDVLDACKAGLGSCLASAHGDLIRLGLCAGQFGVCSAMNLLDCSKDCIPPMISCTKNNMGDFGATFKCVADFIACGIGGCLKGGDGGGGGGPMPPMPPMSDEPVDADKLIKALQPITALTSSAPAAYGLFTDVLDACNAGLGSCLSTTHGDLLRIGLCAGQFGVCSAMNILDCSKDCIPPMISCTKNNMGDFGGTFKCVADFIACGIGGCLKGGGGGGGGGFLPPGPM